MYVYTQTATKYIGSSIITNNMVDVADNTRKDVYNSDDEDEEFEDLGNYEDINNEEEEWEDEEDSEIEGGTKKGT